jgi:hypothetical protein
MLMKTRNRITATTLLLVALIAKAHATDAPLTQITTTDGKTYNNVSVLRSEPDGIIISYQPETPGIGMAKLRFQNLPEAVRSRYSYDADRSSAFEKERSQATAQWRSQLAATDEAMSRYRAFAELNRLLSGDTVSSYSISLSGDGKISAQGFTGSFSPFGCYYPWLNSIPNGTTQQTSTRPPGF